MDLMQLLTRRSTLARAPLKADRSDPFGSNFERKLEMLALLSRRTNGQIFHAERRDKRRGSGVEFAEFRDYVPGDDFRFVDPHAAMRFDRLLLRQYEEEEDPSLYLLIDASLSMGQHRNRKLDHAKRLAAAIAYIGLHALARVTIVALGQDRNLRHPTTRGRGQFPSILRFLRGIEADGKISLESVLVRFARQHRRRGIAVLLSDLFDPAGFERGLDVLRYERFQPHILHLTDAEDFEPEWIGDVTVVDCETFVEHPATITPALLAQLRAAELDRLERARQHCRAHGLGYHPCDVATDFEATVTQLLGQRGRPRV